MDRELLKEIVKTLKEEQVIKDLTIVPFKDEFGHGFEFIHPGTSILRIRKIRPSLSPAELSSGIFYMGGIQFAVILPDEEEVYHTFNLPLQYVNFLIQILDNWVYDLSVGAEAIAEDFRNASLIANARKGLAEQQSMTQLVKQVIDDRDVL